MFYSLKLYQLRCFLLNNVRNSFQEYICHSLPYYIAGEVCETIPPLQFGNSSCPVPINETTDTTCYFNCNKGFNIDGSTNRTCQNNHKWNGTMAKCESNMTMFVESSEIFE